jgi:U3 small nucleolar RNA-associated protein 15
MTTMSGVGASSVPLDAPTKVVRVRLPGVADRATPEERYWRKFVRPIVDTHAAEITHVHCADNSDAPDWAVSTSTRVVVYSGRTGKPKRQLTRFSNLAYSGRLRNDGRLLVAGGESPVVQVFELASRSVLRQVGPFTLLIFGCISLA